MASRTTVANGTASTSPQRGRSPGAPPDDDRHMLQVGERAHRIVASVLHEGIAVGRRQQAIQIMRVGRRIFAEHPVARRPGESLFDAVTGSGVYLARLSPSAPWELLGSEVTSGGCRFDLVFRHPDGRILVDELKLGRNRVGEVQIRGQVDRYLAEGTQRWGEDFVGVRLAAVNKPARSRLYLPIERRSKLVAESVLAEELVLR